MGARPSIREQMQQLREQAILAAVNRLLAGKGYDAMTMDEVAAEAGLAKASLYKLFSSKEELAGAAMVGVLDLALALVDDLRRQAAEAQARGDRPAPLDALKAVTRWAMQTQLDGEMPTLPAQNSTLSAALLSNEAYMDRLVALSNWLAIWITEAQTAGQISPALPSELVLYTLFARACDPVVAMLKDAGQFTPAQIIEWITATTFDGLAAPSLAPPPVARKRRSPGHP